MAIMNLLIFLVGIGFLYEGLSVLGHAETSIHQVYGGVMSGSGGVILAIGCLFFAIAFPDKRN